MQTFNVIGISVETTNANNQAATDLGKLWTQFYAEKIYEKIPNTESSDVYAIYTNYESDYTGKYTAIIGLRVSSLENIPNGLIGKEIKNENLIKYIARGEMPNAVVQTWMEIWNNDKTLNRSYISDFEIYGSKSQNGADSEVEIFIGVK